MPLRRGHASVRAALVVAAVGLLAVATWIVAGDVLPGGRWFAVHLFTLGVLSPLVLALSQHFAATLTRTDEGRTVPLTLLFTAGAVAVLAGVAGGQRLVLVVGATVAAAAVTVGDVRLRRARRSATGARFGWVVRLYERAHGAFLHGAVLGALLGAGVLGGGWYLPARLAHLHANVLGWGVLTLLATVVFLGPTVLRRQIEPGADERAARTLRHGATGLSVALLALLAMGVGGAGAVAARLLAAAGLAVFAWVGTSAVRPVLRTALRGSPSPGRWPLAAACAWLVVGLWADVAVVALGMWAALDALGVLALVGVLLQTILGAAMHLTPVAFGRDRPHRDDLRRRVAHASVPRTVALDLGVLLVVGTAAWRALGGEVTTGLPGGIGWALVVMAVATFPIALSGAALRGGRPVG